MATITHIYNALWTQARVEFERNHCCVDPLIRDPADSRRGTTLLARVSGEALVKILLFMDELKAVAPDQYYYPASDLHLTVLSIISCHKEFQDAPTNDRNYLNLINKCLKEIPPLEIHLSGITASPACLMIQGFPKNDSLQIIRDRLRTAFKQSALKHSIDSRYPIETAHTTVMRFQQPQSDLTHFLRFISKNKTREFGTLKIGTLEFVKNDWYQRQAHSRLIGSFTL